MFLRFGECELDFERRVLLRGGRETPLAPKAWKLLEVLLAARPRAVSKAALHRDVWTDAIVSEATLSSLVTDVRRAIGDDPRRPRLIRTKYGFGYQFCGEAVEVEAGRAGPSPPRADLMYRLIWGRREVELEQGENIIGRTRETVVFIDSPAISRRHAEIRILDGSATIRDLGSKNGTRVRGQVIAETVPLEDGDEIRLGSVLLVFRVFPAAGSTQSEPRATTP